MLFHTESLFWDLLGLVTAVLAIVFVYYKWTYQYWKRRGVISLEPKIPFGNVVNPLSAHVGESIAELYEELKFKGWKYCGIYVLLRPTLLLLDLNLVKHVLTKDFEYFTDRGGYTNEKIDPVGAHLFAIGGTKWRNLRAKLTPTFTSGKLKSMFQSLVDCGLVLEKYIEENIKEDAPLDIKNILGCFSTDVIGSCAFGIDCNSFKEPDSLFRQYGNNVFIFSKRRIIQSIIATNFPYIGHLLGIRQIPKDIGDFFTKVVEDTVSYREANHVVRKDFLQLLIDIRTAKDQEDNETLSGDGTILTMQEIVAQSFVFFAAGFETSSTTMSFALFELATNPDIQDRLRDEIITILANNNDQITYDSLSEMKYLGQVIDETLRLHSPARLLRRVCTKDYKLPGEDIVIEKGTQIFVPVKGIHYDERYWENPKEFNPDRFSAENKKHMNQYTHLPFGQGPRSCIGERFGIMQVKVGLTCLLRKFRVTLNKRTKLPLSMSATTMVSSVEGGIWIDLEKI